LLHAFKREKPQIPVIMMTGWEGASPSAAIDQGAFHLVNKPFDLDEMQGVIEHAIADSVRPRGTTKSTSDLLLPAGTCSRELLNRIDLLASSSAPVLIHGESGSGKELAARAIHARGPRARAPFVAINTAAIPEHILESELFGHVRGAFSGAAQSRTGLLLAATHGTVLLDEIGDMPLGLQAKLLRVLQFGEVRAVGSDRAQTVDVRFLAATHRDLPACIKAGSFRQDLYFRLNVLELRVPSLRERRAEIPGLISHFLQDAREKSPHSPVRYLTEDAIRALTRAAWPGNVRELANAIERLVVMGNSAAISASDVALLGLLEPRNANDGEAATVAPEQADSLLSEAQRGIWSLAELNQRYVDWVLARTNGDKVQAARILGINLSTLYRWRLTPRRHAAHRQR
jgi:two-component system response regulator HydG